MPDEPRRVLLDSCPLLPNRPSLLPTPPSPEPAGASDWNSMRPVERRSDSATRGACPKGPSPEQRTPRHVSTQSRGPRSGIRREQASAPAHAHRADGSAAAFPLDRACSRNDRPPRDEQIGMRCARRRVPKTRSRDRPGLPASNDELESPAASRLCPGILVRAPWRYAHATPGVDCAEECHRPFPAPGRA